MIKQTKCAKITECDVDSNSDRVIYNAKPLAGDEKFSYNGTKETLTNSANYEWICPKDEYVMVEYKPEECSKSNFCEADEIQYAFQGNGPDCGW